MADGGVIAVDQGTSATKALLVDASGDVVGRTSVAVDVAYPAPGWVEQDPGGLLDSVRTAIAELGGSSSPAALALSVQRESAVVWERASGRPVGPVLGWQDRRTQPTAAKLLADGVAEEVAAISGLPLDPMFSALKFAWLLDDVDPDRRRSRNGELAVGTLDCWLTAVLTGEHRIEIGNASRTQLLDVERHDWSATLCELFDVPSAALPVLQPSDAPVAVVDGACAGAPLAAVFADSHAALFAHHRAGAADLKATYGTGSSIIGLAPDDAKWQPEATAASGVVRTLAWQRDGARPRRAYEGNVLATGAAVVWLAELLGRTTDELAELAAAGTPSDVVLVPAFGGLGAPWWDGAARGLVANLDLSSGPAQLAGAAFEAIAWQIDDVIAAIESLGAESGAPVAVDGGPTSNDWLMQLQADVSGRTVVAAAEPMLSAFGAAQLAGLAIGLWDDATAPGFGYRSFQPNDDDGAIDERTRRQRRWHAAVAKARRGDE